MQTFRGALILDSGVKILSLNDTENMFLGSSWRLIHDHILKRLSDDRVFWRRPDPEDPQNFMLITSIEDRTLIIDYREDTEAPIRTIIELRIFRE